MGVANASGKSSCDSTARSEYILATGTTTGFLPLSSLLWLSFSSVFDLFYPVLMGFQSFEEMWKGLI